MTRIEPDEVLDGPEFEIWNHLESGLDLARMEFEEGLSEEERTFYMKFGEDILSLQINRLIAPDDSTAGLAGASHLLLKVPWIKFAVDFAFANQTLPRATGVFDRYVELQPILTRYELSDVAAKCLQEAGWTFLFSFDFACVVSCTAVLEQMLAKELVDGCILTWDELKRCRYTAGKLFQKAKKERFLPEQAEQAASELIEMRNKVMHRRFEASKDEALKAMENLGIVLQDLGR